jgi:hypothetical protein
MPLSGFDKASSSINKRKAARQKASQLRTSKIKEANSERNAFNKIATKGQKRVNSRRGTDTYRKSVLDAQPKSPTTPESLQKINSPYVGFNPFGGMGEKQEKQGSNGQLGNEIKTRAKARVVNTVASPATKIKVDVSNKLTPSAPKATTIENKAPKKPRHTSDKTAMRKYEKQTRDYKRKTETSKSKSKPKASRRKQKGSKAATLKKGFGY